MRLRSTIEIALLGAVVAMIAGCGGTDPVDEISVDESGPLEPVKPPEFGPDDWPWWRGPDRNGVARGGAPVQWSETENVAWKSPVPGRGHSSPTVVANAVFLTTADEQREVQSVLCYDRSTGDRLWKEDIHQGGFDRRAHSKNSQATPSVACDGRRVFASFLNDEAIWVTALSLDGERLWQTEVGPFESSYGYAASPLIFQSLVIVAADHNGGGFLAALHRATGKIVWRKPRPAEQSYSSPIVADVAGRDQVLLAGTHLVAAYDPRSGEELWSVEATTESVAGTMNYWSDLVFAGAGYPDSEVVCIRADGSGEIVWQNRTKMYVPSLLVHDGYVYAVNDDGRAYCWDARTGNEKWRGRMGGKFSASPILAGGHIYVPSENGIVTVFEATPQTLNKVARIRMGEEIMASPTICGGRIYLRVASRSTGHRQETLYCIGEGGT